MSTQQPAPLSNVYYLPDRAAVRSDARAYGGPAHGQQWTVDPVDPAPWVELPTGSSSSLYRLARHPRTGRPVWDHLDNLLYVPLTDVAPRTGTRDGARILAFRGNGPTGCRPRRAGEGTTDPRREVSAPTPSTGAAGTDFPLDEDVTG